MDLLAASTRCSAAPRPKTLAVLAYAQPTGHWSFQGACKVGIFYVRKAQRIDLHVLLGVTAYTSKTLKNKEEYYKYCGDGCDTAVELTLAC